MTGYLIDKLHEGKQTPKACLLFLKGKSGRVAIWKVARHCSGASLAFPPLMAIGSFSSMSCIGKGLSEKTDSFN